MSPFKLTPEQRELLRDIRSAGVVDLSPENPSFAGARDLEELGLLRAVPCRKTAGATFVLSGRGIAAVASPRA